VGQKREFYRIAVDRSGTVRRGQETVACEVLDLTEKGVQLTTDLPVRVGETLELDFSVTDAVAIHCSIMVTRVSGKSVGSCISDIAPDDQERLSRFINDLVALNLGGF
jgi:hypothetical protein